MNPSSLIPTVGNTNHANQNFWALTPRQRQTFLRQHGYNVVVDGLPGPQTLDASKAWLAGVPAAVWNRKGSTPSGASRTPTPPAARGTPPRNIQAAPPGASPISGDPSTRAGMGLGPAAAAPPFQIPGYRPSAVPGITMPETTPGSIMGDLEQLGYTHIDPNNYAETIANLQYNSAIQELARQQQLVESAGIGAQSSITDWFNQLQSQLGIGAKERQGVFESGRAGLEASGKGLMAAFGGGANDAMGVEAADVSNQIAGLTGLNQAAANFDSRMGPIFASQAADAHTAEQLTTQQQLADLAAKLVSLQQDKGYAQSKAYYEGLGLDQQMMGNALDMYGQLRGMDAQKLQSLLALRGANQDWTTQDIQNQAAVQNMNIAQAMLPYTFGQAGADLAGKTIANAQGAAAVQGQQIANQQGILDYTTTTAQFQQWLKQHSGRVGITDPTGAQLSSPQLAALSDRIYKQLVDPMGKPKVGSNQAFSFITQQLRGMGMDINTPAVQQFRQMVLKTLYPQVTFGPKGNPVRTH